jgi:hypothetical protein
VLRSLPRAASSDGKTESLTRGVVREKVFGRFVELLSADRATYLDKVDYFEVRFDGAWLVCVATRRGRLGVTRTVLSPSNMTRRAVRCH